MRRTSRPCAALAALAIVASASVAIAPSHAAAQIASGSTLVFSGVTDATDLGSPGVLLDFMKHVTADPSANTGTFATLNRPKKGQTGNIAPMVVGNGPQAVSKFLKIGGFHFDLSFVPSGAYGQDECYVDPAVGQRCTPFQLPSYELSPFYLENRASGIPQAPFTSIIAFDVVGTVRGRGTTTDFFGTIVTTFVGVSFQEALLGLEAFGLEGVPFTGTFVAGGPTTLAASSLAATSVSVAPEPSTVALMATGLVGVAALARRRRTLG